MGYGKERIYLNLKTKIKVKVVELKLQRQGEEIKAGNENKRKENLGC
jgi:hypothetical protein